MATDIDFICDLVGVVDVVFEVGVDVVMVVAFVVAIPIVVPGPLPENTLKLFSINIIMVTIKRIENFIFALFLDFLKI